MISSHCRATIGHFVDAGDEIEILVDGQVVVEAEPLRHISDLPADRLSLVDDVVAEACPAAAIRNEEPAQHADRRGLAAAVGTEKAAYFTGADLQREAFDDFVRAETLAQVVNVDDQVRHCGGGLRHRTHRHRLTGVDQRRLLRRRARLHQVDQLGAIGVAVDHRRRIFGLRRDERNRRLEIGGTIVADEADLIAEVDARQLRLGHEETHENILGR